MIDNGHITQSLQIRLADAQSQLLNISGNGYHLGQCLWLLGTQAFVQFAIQLILQSLLNGDTLLGPQQHIDLSQRGTRSQQLLNECLAHETCGLQLWLVTSIDNLRHYNQHLPVPPVTKIS